MLELIANLSGNMIISNSKLATDVTIDVMAALPLSIGGSGRNQTIEIKTSGQGVTVNGHLSGGGTQRFQ